MIEYVYYDTWFLWNPGAILFYTIISVVIYLVMTSKDESIDQEKLKKIKDPKLVATIPAVLSVVDLGAYCIITIGLYWMIATWIERKRNKEVI